MQATPAVDVGCHHCGALCPPAPPRADDHVFCCQGCLAVYELLRGHDLHGYYTLRDRPARRVEPADGRYAAFDQPEVARRVLDFREGTLSRVTFLVPAVHCSACVWLLERLPRLCPGVRHARVHFARREVTCVFDHAAVSLRSLAGQLAALGYAPELSADRRSGQAAAPPRNRALVYQLGVAGFCFGNIMLLTLPGYLDADFADEAAFRRVFGYLSLLLALPTFFYAGAPYLRAAWRGLHRGQLPLDVPIALGMIVLLGRSTYEMVADTGPGYFDSLAGLVFFLLIGKWYQRYTYEALSYDRDYRSYFPMTSTRLEPHGDGEREVATPLDDLRSGDCVLVRHGELIPADATLRDGQGHIDYSFVTGESEPLGKQPGDSLFAGGRQNGGPLRITLCRPVAQSYLTRLWNQDAFRKPHQDRLRGLVDGLGRHFTAAVLCIALATGLFWAWHDPATLPAAVTAVLIVACPCALALAAPFALGHTLRCFGRRGCYLKNTDALERLAQVDQLIFDKTGTLTHPHARRVHFVGEPLREAEVCWVRSVAHNSAHPLSRALCGALPANGPPALLGGFVETSGRGVAATVGGHAVRLGSAPFVGAAEPPDAAAAGGGARVYVAIDGQVRGHYAFEAHYRAGIDPLLTGLRRRYTTHLLSGDDARAAPRLAPYFAALRFRQSPLDKLRYVEALGRAGHRTLMVGDGLNDAGALKQSDVGMAIADDIYRFSPACDAILDARRLPQLEQFLRLARAGRRITLIAFGLSFLYNAVGLGFAVTGLLTPVVAAVLMPLSSVTVVGFVTAAVHFQDRRLFRS